MKFRLKHHFQIESARFLPNLAEGHPCKRMHGHSFKIIVSFITTQDAHIGWGLDYHEITTKMKPVLEQLDHRVLNEVAGLENPTSENLAVWLYHKVGSVFNSALVTVENISVQETPLTECIYPAQKSHPMF